MRGKARLRRRAVNPWWAFSVSSRMTGPLSDSADRQHLTMLAGQEALNLSTIAYRELPFRTRR